MANPNIEEVTIITSKLSQPLEGSGLRVIYLAERRVTAELDYDEFSRTCLMPSLIFAASPAVVALIYPPRLSWLVYAYGLEGFAQEHPIGRKTNVTNYPFPDGTRAPIVQDHEELIWLVGNLKLEVTKYSRELYGGEDVGDDNDNDDDGGGGGGDSGGGSESTPSH
ncbi:hypothetical protein SO802_017520 [Lithocarpus litseifolius]|uniref:Uncharacterized protein n=1 Tax=Lithocarpus litseifolius TaxID=425828 RepID=A0AAW2CIE8_9ROSI